MLREYQHSILFVEKCLHVHKFVYISYEINIRKSLQVDLQVDQKLHEFFLKSSLKDKKYENLCIIPIFKTRKACTLL